MIIGEICIQIFHRGHSERNDILRSTLGIHPSTEGLSQRPRSSSCSKSIVFTLRVSSGHFSD